MIAAKVGCNEIERVEEKVQKKVFYLRELQADVELLAERESDPATKTALTQLAEEIQFSDPMSHEQLSELERQITTKIVELRTAENKTQIIAEVRSFLDERNKKCKILK